MYTRQYTEYSRLKTVLIAVQRRVARTQLSRATTIRFPNVRIQIVNWYQSSEKKII